MNIDKNDPKWTAYALNELSEAETTACEQELANNPEAQQLVEEIRSLGGQLSSHYTAESDMGLTEEQHETIRQAARNKPKSKIIAFPRYVWMPLASTAAVAIFLGVCLPKVGGRLGKADNIAYAPQPQKLRPKMERRQLQMPVPELKRANKPMVKIKKLRHPASAPAVSLSEISVRSRRSDELSEGIGGFQMIADIGMSCMGGIEEEGSRRPTWISPSIEDYTEIKENLFTRVQDEPLSTFSIDVDTASYANVRRFLKDGMMPPKDAVRIEEMINYFNYSYAPPRNKRTPFATHLEQAACPWDPEHQLVRIGLKGYEVDSEDRPALNLTFLLDVSGSMNSSDKLPLVKRAMSTLTRQLDDRDHVSIVVYAGASGLVLPPTSGADRQAILGALKRLNAGGGTNGGQGIELAYQTAMKHFDEEGVNRVILCTDGDFNIGVTQGGDLNRLIEKKAKSGIFLSVLGFGTGNVKDSTMEQLADRGNGNYAYIDTFSEARKVLVDEMSGTLLTIAKDVKIQVEFNPALVAGYRLIGYENRTLATEDFNDDTKDAGEIGAGHTVTALYEIVPAGQDVNGVPPVDELKYQQAEAQPIPSKELLTVKLRYKQPDRDTSTKVSFPLMNSDLEEASQDFQFATAVAGFGMLLRDSEFKGDLTYDQVIEWAEESQGKDAFGYRREFINLVRNAKSIAP